MNRRLYKPFQQKSMLLASCGQMPGQHDSDLMRAVNRQPGFRPGTRRVFEGQAQEEILPDRALKISGSIRCVFLKKYAKLRETLLCVTFFGEEKNRRQDRSRRETSILL